MNYLCRYYGGTGELNMRRSKEGITIGPKCCGGHYCVEKRSQAANLVEVGKLGNVVFLGDPVQKSVA